MKVPAGGGNRSGMLKNAVAGVGNEEGRRRRKRGEEDGETESESNSISRSRLISGSDSNGYSYDSPSKYLCSPSFLLSSSCLKKGREGGKARLRLQGRWGGGTQINRGGGTEYF